MLTAGMQWRRLAFVSDLHLGPDAPRTAAHFLQWLHNGARQADALFILGDLFEAWIGDDLLEAGPADIHHEVCDALSRFCATGRFLGVMHGNRDFLLGTGFARRTGAQLLEDPCELAFAGQRIVLTHGDALCVADIAYQQWRERCRQPAWQQQILAQPLQARRQQAAALRAQSREAQARMETWSDADAAEAARWLDRAGSSWMIHGHTHRPQDHWEDARLRQVLADWDLDVPAGERPRQAQALWLNHGTQGTITVHRQQLAELGATPAP
jgi:UDP-2,3-diacylglucosamine hydrolase